MGILFEASLRVGDADETEQLDRAPVRRGAVGAAMLLQGLGYLPADGEHRVERGHRLLEHHADVAPAHLAHFFAGKLHEVAAEEAHLAAGDPPGRIRDQAQDGERADRLARPAFADDRDGFARLDGVGNPVHRADDSRAGAELRVQVSDIQEWRQDLSRRFLWKPLVVLTCGNWIRNGRGRGCQRRAASPQRSIVLCLARHSRWGKAWRMGRNSTGGWPSSPARRAISGGRSPVSWRWRGRRSWVTPAPARRKPRPWRGRSRPAVGARSHTSPT